MEAEFGVDLSDRKQLLKAEVRRRRRPGSGLRRKAPLAETYPSGRLPPVLQIQAYLDAQPAVEEEEEEEEDEAPQKCAAGAPSPATCLCTHVTLTMPPSV